MELKLYTIDNKYVDFLRVDKKLSNVFENKDDSSHFIRKYLGVVLTIGTYEYYVPLSSPKDSDYIMDGSKKLLGKVSYLSSELLLKIKLGSQN